MKTLTMLKKMDHLKAFYKERVIPACLNDKKI